MKLPKLNYYDSQKWILEKCQDKSILHLGCAGDITLNYGKESALRFNLAKIYSENLWGIELNLDALDYVKKLVPETNDDNIKYFNANVEDLKLMPHKKFDIILAGSIIEHLSNPGLILNEIKPFLHKESVLLVTTPHVWGIFQFFRVALRKNEAVNPEHTCWYSIPTITELVSKYDYVPVQFNTGYGFHPDSFKWKLKKKLGKYFFNLFPHLGGSLLCEFKLS
jgi:2-polyprenyl-3-methyl-5-hydroxy-6-metoxy-1,4-benzoquinol methylase